MPIYNKNYPSENDQNISDIFIPKKISFLIDYHNFKQKYFSLITAKTNIIIHILAAINLCFELQFIT